MRLDVDKAYGSWGHTMSTVQKTEKTTEPSAQQSLITFRSGACSYFFLAPFTTTPPFFPPPDKVVQSLRSLRASRTFARHTIELFQWTSDRLAGNLMRVRFSPGIPPPNETADLLLTEFAMPFHWPATQFLFFSTTFLCSCGYVKCSMSIFYTMFPMFRRKVRRTLR